MISCVCMLTSGSGRPALVLNCCIHSSIVGRNDKTFTVIYSFFVVVNVGLLRTIFCEIILWFVCELESECGLVFWMIAIFCAMTCHCHWIACFKDNLCHRWRTSINVDQKWQLHFSPKSAVFSVLHSYFVAQIIRSSTHCRRKIHALLRCCAITYYCSYYSSVCIYISCLKNHCKPLLADDVFCRVCHCGQAFIAA